MKTLSMLITRAWISLPSGRSGFVDIGCGRYLVSVIRISQFSQQASDEKDGCSGDQADQHDDHAQEHAQPYKNGFHFCLSPLDRSRFLPSLASGVDTNYGDEMQVQVPDLGQDSMQSRLIPDWAGNLGLAVFQGGQRQPFEPGAPVAVQLASDANFVILIFRCVHRCNLPAIEPIVSVRKEYLEEY